MSTSKVMTAGEAIGKYIKDGDCLALGGFVTNRRAYGLVRAIIAQGIKNLYIEGGPSGGDVDMLIGAKCAKAINISYIANSGYTQVGRRFRAAVENKEILFEDYSMDVQTIAYHGAALGLSYVPVKNMLGSDLVNKWGISEEERKRHPKISAKKLVIQEDPFNSGSFLCCVPTPQIDVACIHVQQASPNGICRIAGPLFQDLDIAMAAKYAIVSCEELVSDEEIRRQPELNTITGLCVDAVVPMAYGAHPSQCFGFYDYDSNFYMNYEKVSRTQEAFDEFIEAYIDGGSTHASYLDKIGVNRLLELKVHKGYGYVPGLKRR